MSVCHAIYSYRESLSANFLLTALQWPVRTYEMILAPYSNVLERLTGAVGERALERGEELLIGAGVAYQKEIYSGDPAKTLVTMAIEWVAIPSSWSRGREALRSALLGSVSRGYNKPRLYPSPLLNAWIQPPKRFKPIRLISRRHHPT